MNHDDNNKTGFFDVVKALFIIGLFVQFFMIAYTYWQLADDADRKSMVRQAIGFFLVIVVTVFCPPLGLILLVAGSAIVVKKWYSKNTASRNEIVDMIDSQQAVAQEWKQWESDVQYCRDFVKKYIADNQWHFLSSDKHDRFYAWLEGDQVDPADGKALPYNNMRGYEKFVHEYDEVDRILEMQYWCVENRLCPIDGSPVSDEVAESLGMKQ